MTAAGFVRVLLSIPCSLLFALVIHRLMGIRKSWWRRGALFAGCIVVSNIPIHVGDAVNILGVLPVFFLCVWFCCEGSGAARASLALILFPVAMSISAVVDTSLLGAPYARLIIKTLVWLGIWLVCRRLLTKELLELRPHLWALVDILATLPLLTVVCTVALNDIRNLALSEWILLPISAVVSIALLFAVVLLAKQEKTEQENRLFQMRNQYYESLEREQWQVRRLRHDMANHLQTMARLDDNAARKYLKNLIDSPGMAASIRYCENDVANTVLCSKAAHMQTVKIHFDCRARIPVDLQMDDLDLASLLANSLDNAIEACEKLPEEGREITLDAAVDRGMFALEVCNPSPPPRTAGGEIISEKHNRLRHGFGLSGMKEIAGRYGGKLEYGYQDGVFRLFCTVLLDQQDCLAGVKSTKI